ncbi:MAG: glutaredoxin family protein [bacterium]|nr:glutaredoxin family protein [bacterium]
MSYKNQVKIVPGKKGKEIMVFSLSTCFWCKKTMDLLSEFNLEYGYIDFDLLEGRDQKEAYDEISKYNPNASFPTTVVNNGEKIIIGFDETEIKNLADGK